MIKGLQGDAYITISGGNTSVPYVNQNSNNPLQGAVRVWGIDMQVFDGSNWVPMNSSYATVTLNGVYQLALEWVVNKMIDEKEMLAAADKHPAVKIAMDNFSIAKEQLDVTIILCKEHNESTS